jgi:hypothetical protein
MHWTEVRVQNPDQWLLVEALQAHSVAGKRILDDLKVIKSFSDSVTAMHHYAELHHQTPQREMYVLHTSRDQIDIQERTWYR